MRWSPTHDALVPVALALLIGLGHWAGLARAVFGFPVYAAALDLVLVSLLAATSLVAFRTKRRPALHPLDIAVAAFALLTAIQILNPNVPSVQAGLEGFRKSAFMICGYAIVRTRARDQWAWFFPAIVIVSIPALLWALRQPVLPLPLDRSIMDTAGASPISFRLGTHARAFAPFTGPFHLGIVAGAIALISMVLASALDRRYLIAGVIAGVSLGLSITRANIAGTVAASLVIVAVAAFHGRALRYGIRAAAIIFAVAVALGWAVAPTAPAPGQVQTPPQPNTAPTSRPSAGPLLPNPAADPNLKFRFQFWEAELSAIADRPLIGYGTSSAADGFAKFYRGTTSVNFAPHSIYIKPAIELGIPGFVLFVVVMGLGLRSITRVWRHSPAVALIGTGVASLLAISGLTGPMLDAYPFNLLAWATLGIMTLSEDTGDESRPVRSRQCLPHP